MVFKKRPMDFNPMFEVVSCFCRWDDRILLLKRQTSKPQGGTWGVPAGKVNKDDISTGAAMVRELTEETGIIMKVTELKYFGKVYVRYADFDFIYYIFQTEFKGKPDVKIRREEHQSYNWVTPEEAHKMKLIEDLDKCLELTNI